MTSNTTEALGHVTSADVQQPRTIYVQFSEIGTIRKWAWEPFDKAEPLIAENGWVSDTPTLCATGDDGELADLFWRIKEKMPVHHEELLDLADRIEALRAEVERLREALGHAIGIIEAHVDRDALGKNGDPKTGMWPLLDEYLYHFRQALGDNT